LTSKGKTNEVHASIKEEVNASMQTSRRENDKLIKNDCSNASVRKILAATCL